MAKSVTFRVDGIKGKDRPRYGRFSDKPHNTEATTSYENWVRWCYRDQVGSSKLEGYIKADITCIYEVPKSYSKKVKNAIAQGEIKPDKKPDLDNIAKIILDALNKVAYEDDKQVIELNIRKQYGELGHVVIELSEIHANKTEVL